MSISRRLLSTATAVAALFAFHVSGAPAQENETWSLVEVGGEALPIVVDQEDDCREELIAGTLTVDADGTWTFVTREREICGDDVEVSEDREEGRHVLDGETVRFLDEDGEPQDDEDGDDDEDGELDVEDLTIGTRSGATMTVEVADGTGTLLFRR